MRAFRTSLLILLLLVFSVVALSMAGRGALAEYREAVPGADAPLSEAGNALSALLTQIEDGRLLLALLFAHERCDDLESAVARCAAAARANEYAEYAILRAELLRMIDAMERDLRPGVLDVL